MISHNTDKFRKAFRNLPVPIQRKARKAFHRWREDPDNPLLHFKPIYPSKPVYSIRIGLGWRAVGLKAENHLIRLWIGSHADYDNLIKYL